LAAAAGGGEVLALAGSRRKLGWGCVLAAFAPLLSVAVRGARQAKGEVADEAFRVITVSQYSKRN